MVTRVSLGAALFGVLALGACVDPMNEQNRTVTGAATGAAIGGVIGAATGSGDNRLGRALVGAGAGAIAGGLIGQQLDRQAAELRAQLGSDVDIRNTGEELILTMPQDILFDFDSAVVRPELRSDLRVISANLINNPSSLIQVVGHTDNVGSAEYNLDLSERRANSVAAELRASGVPSARIVTIGRGLTQPVASNETSAGRAQNRRVEIIIRPTTA